MSPSTLPGVENALVNPDDDLLSRTQTVLTVCECFVVVRATNYAHLLQGYISVFGPTNGAAKLQMEFATLFEAAQQRVGVKWSNLTSQHGSACFVTKSANEADALAAEIIEFAHERSADTGMSGYRKQMVAGVLLASYADATPPIGTSLVKAATPIACSSETISTAEYSVEPRGSGDIRITEEAFQFMSQERQFHYGTLQEITQTSHGRPLLGRKRRIISDSDIRTMERCIMRIDMSEFSRIQRELSNALSPVESTKLVATLQREIQQLITHGFACADVPYEKACLEFGGDGGIFVFDDCAMAHRVAVAILRRTEEYNKRPRDAKSMMGCRCFRVGIAYGPLSTDTQGKFAGAAISNAVRLEAGGPSGEIRISPEVYSRLPDEFRQLYGGEEELIGKTHDPVIQARRYVVVPCAPWPERAWTARNTHPGRRRRLCLTRNSQ